MFFSWVGPKSVTARSSRPLTCQYACSDRQIAPGSAIPSNRAAMLTPSPIKSPSLSSAQVDADTEDDALIGRCSDVSLDHGVLNCDGAPHRFDDAAKFDQSPVASALDDASVMRGDGGIDQIAAKPPQPRQRAILVRPGEPGIADHVRNQ